MKKICLIDYGSGNQKSMYNLLDYLGYKVKLSNSIFDIETLHILYYLGLVLIQSL